MGEKVTGKPSISVGSVGLSGEFTAAYSEKFHRRPVWMSSFNVWRLMSLISSLSVARLLQDPQWVHKIREGAYR